MKILDRLFQYKHTNSKGVKYYLFWADANLRGGYKHRIYYFAKNKTQAKGKPSRLPKDKYVNENPRNGFLTVKAKSEAEQSIK